MLAVKRVAAPACATAAAVLAMLWAPDTGAEQRVTTVSQGTNIALALFPDGESLVVDLLGRLWRLPAAGGGAEQLTPDDEGARHPRVSPDGRRVVYQRLVDGQWDLWILEVETGERRALLASEHDEREPDFTQDGRSVVFAANRGETSADLWRIGVDDGVLTRLTAEPGDAAFPTVSAGDEIAYVRREPDGWSLRALLPTGAAIELYRSPQRLSAPSWRDGGGVIVFNEQRPAAAGSAASSELKMIVLAEAPVVKSLTRAEDVFESRVAWISPAEYIYAADGRIWRRGIAYVTREPVPLIAAITVDSIAPPPIDTQLDAPGPNSALGIAGRSRSADGRVEVFAALGDLWLIERRDRARRLTDDAFVDVSPSVSPRGDFAVFASDRGGNMNLWRISLPDGALTPLTRTAAKAYSPAVSADGGLVAFLETDAFDSLGDARLRVLSAADGTNARTVATGLAGAADVAWEDSGRISVATRTAGGRPVRLAFDPATGRSVAPPAARADAPGEPLPRLDWQPSKPDEPYVVQVGRLFDAIRTDYVRHVDVHVEGQRIKAIVARGLLPLPDRVIDLRDATVIPGLIDVHAHQSSLLGERLGRAWLAHGVTTVRELTDDVAGALERAESWASGRRLGPRLIVSPAAAVPGRPVSESARDAPDAPDPAMGLVSDSPARSAPQILPTPIPVRGYTGLAAASTLFLGAAVPLGGLAAEHPPTGPWPLFRTSPLALSYEDVFRTIVESRTIVMSDLAAVGGMPRDAAALRRLIAHPVFRAMYTDEERERWLSRAAPAGSLAALQQNVARLIRAGGLVATGTESPLIPYGLGVHLELALLADAGIPLDQVLRIATASNAYALGLDRQLGTLEADKLADFVVVEGSPLDNIADALNVLAVVRGGVWLDSARLAGP